MPTYISMLRGINVGGHNPVKMYALRELFESLGFEQVQTYIQSGNVVFKAGKSSSLQLSKKIEERIAKEFGFRMPVVSRTSAEMGSVIESNPLAKTKDIDLTKLHVTFLSEAPDPAALKKLEPLAATPDAFRSCGSEIYLYCPNGYSNTKLTNNAIERILAVPATTRNWNTVNKLYEMSLGRGG
jgi:uncharacterized protein (DUF1697 family)